VFRIALSSARDRGDGRGRGRPAPRRCLSTTAVSVVRDVPPGETTPRHEAGSQSAKALEELRTLSDNL
jgi:hypothetical protein